MRNRLTHIGPHAKLYTFKTLHVAILLRAVSFLVARQQNFNHLRRLGHRQQNFVLAWLEKKRLHKIFGSEHA